MEYVLIVLTIIYNTILSIVLISIVRYYIDSIKNEIRNIRNDIKHTYNYTQEVDTRISSVYDVLNKIEYRINSIIRRK